MPARVQCTDLNRSYAPRGRLDVHGLRYAASGFTRRRRHSPLRVTGSALLTLLHEAAHTRGLVDEGETDCFALGLVRRYAVSLLGVLERVSRIKIVTRYKRLRVDRRWVRRRVKVRVRVLVPAPRLDVIVADLQYDQCGA